MPRNATRAERKKAQRVFKVGDVVTWGVGSIAHRVVQVTPEGIFVDVTSQKDADRYAIRQPDGRYWLLVLYDGNMRRWDAYRAGATRGPPRHSDLDPS
jgi:hypothetical protein